MKSIVIAVVFSAFVFSQQPPPKVAPGTPAPPAPPQLAPGTPAPAPPAPVSPDSVVLMVDGKKITAAEMDKFFAELPPQVLQAVKGRPESLSQIFLMKRLLEDAEKAGIDKKSPYKEQIEFNRLQLLAQAELTEYGNNIRVVPEDEQKYYKDNPDKYKQAKVRVIQIVFSPTPDKPGADGKKLLSEADAKVKIEDLRKQIVAGADFGKLARENSDDKTSAAKDGDFGTMKRSSSYPEPVKAAVFALKAGEVSQPVRQPNGFYLIRVDEFITQPFEEVSAEIYQEIRQQRMGDYFKKVQAQYQVKVENPAYFSPQAAPQLQPVR